jgi:hypothetical protein
MDISGITPIPSMLPDASMSEINLRRTNIYEA